MNFQIKTEDDPLDDNGYIKNEQCFICKWFIEKGNYFLQLGCQHRFHKKCMEVQLLTNSRCAKCHVEADFQDLFTPELINPTGDTVVALTPNL